MRLISSELTYLHMMSSNKRVPYIWWPTAIELDEYPILDEYSILETSYLFMTPKYATNTSIVL